MNNKFLLLLGCLLLCIGFLGPKLTNTTNNNSCNVISPNYITNAPIDPVLLEKSKKIIDILKESSATNKKNDCLRLSSLYADLATLIELDGSEEVIKDTAAIRQANSLAGPMLRLDIKGKYDNLSASAENLVVSSLGDSDTALDSKLRTKAVEVFNALSWAFYEGSK